MSNLNIESGRLNAASTKGLGHVLLFMVRREIVMHVQSIDTKVNIGNEKYGTAIRLPRRYEKQFPAGAEVRAFMFEDRGQLGLMSQLGDKLKVVPLVHVNRILAR